MAAIAGMMFFIVFVCFGIGVVIAILYLLNLQNTLKSAAPENRKMPPANVWLLLIPLFSTYYLFVVAQNISDTIRAEYASKGQNPGSPRPAYKVGMAMAIGSAISTLISLITFKEWYNDTMTVINVYSSGNYEAIMNMQTSGSLLSSIGSYISFAVFILWIVYWVQTAGYKNKMRNLPSNNPDSQIFNPF